MVKRYRTANGELVTLEKMVEGSTVEELLDAFGYILHTLVYESRRPENKTLMDDVRGRIARFIRISPVNGRSHVDEQMSDEELSNILTLSAGILKKRGVSGFYPKLEELTGPSEEEIDDAFERIVFLQNNPEGRKPKRKPFRIERMWHAFQGRWTKLIPADEVYSLYAENVDPRGQCHMLILKINKMWESEGFDLQLRALRSSNEVAYTVRRRSRNSPSVD